MGTPQNSELTQQRLGVLSMVNCVSRGYAERRGVPRRLDELDAHDVIRYASALSSDVAELEYVVDGEVETRAMSSAVTVNGADAYMAACLAGLGIIQVPLLGARDRLASGQLVEVLPDHRCPPMPVSLLHTHGRSPPRRVRVVMRWLEEALVPHLE